MMKVQNIEFQYNGGNIATQKQQKIKIIKKSHPKLHLMDNDLLQSFSNYKSQSSHKSRICQTPQLEQQGKIPQIPITLMNSSMVSKKIELQWLVSQKKIVDKHKRRRNQIKEQSMSLAEQEQENAIKEMLNKYKNHFKTTESKKKKEIEILKSHYSQSLFLKNQKKEIKRTDFILKFPKYSRIKTINSTKQTSAPKNTFCEYLQQIKRKHQTEYQLTVPDLVKYHEDI